MYIPTTNRESDPSLIFDFIDANPLGILVTSSGELAATHLPLVLHRSAGAAGVLQGHIARANSEHAAHAAHDATTEALVIFTGPDAYITPNWYETKRLDGKVVPTWNYIAVHVYGTLRFTDDTTFLRRHLEELVTRHEAPRPHPWAVSDAPSDYIAQQMRAIVGLELSITRMEGKWKMSQNRSAQDIQGVVEGLESSEVARDREVGRIVDARRPQSKL